MSYENGQKLLPLPHKYFSNCLDKHFNNTQDTQKPHAVIQQYDKKIYKILFESM
jgi:hypothetical protein